MILQINEPVYEVIVRILSMIALEIVSAIPGIIVTIIVFALVFLVIKLLNPLIYKVSRLVNLDNLTKYVFGFSFPFSLTRLVVYLADAGLVLISILVLVTLLLGPQATQVTVQALSYIARLVSVLAVTFFILSAFNIAIDKVQGQSKLRGYTLFIIILIVTSMLIDITALTDSAKAALMAGLSTGIGISVGVFATWFFFGEMLEKYLLGKRPDDVQR